MNDIHIFIFIPAGIFIYIIIGAGCWAYWDKDGQLLDRATNDHELLPLILMVTWPIFLYKYLKNGGNHE